MMDGIFSSDKQCEGPEQDQAGSQDSQEEDLEAWISRELLIEFVAQDFGQLSFAARGTVPEPHHLQDPSDHPFRRTVYQLPSEEQSGDQTHEQDQSEQTEGLVGVAAMDEVCDVA